MSRFREQLVIEMLREELKSYRLPRNPTWSGQAEVGSSGGQTTAEFAKSTALRAHTIAAACCKVWGHEVMEIDGGFAPIAHAQVTYRQKVCARCGYEITKGAPRGMQRPVVDEDE